MFKIYLVTLHVIFKAYETRIDLPIPAGLLKDTSEIEIQENFLEWLFGFSLYDFVSVGWILDEPQVYYDEICQTDINSFLDELPDGNDPAFGLFRGIVDFFEKHGDEVRYFGILSYPQLGKLESWLQKTQDKNKCLYDILKKSKESLKESMTNNLNSYEMFTVNGTVYIPVVFGYFDDELIYDITIAHMLLENIFDAYVLHKVYEIALGRGFQDNNGCNERV